MAFNREAEGFVFGNWDRSFREAAVVDARFLLDSNLFPPNVSSSDSSGY